MAETSFEFWFISIPNNKNAKKSVGDLEQIASSRQGKCFYLDKVPTTKLRVGTLDNLIGLSEEIGKIDAFGKNLCNKLHRTYLELEDTDQLLNINNKSIRGYITSFEWDDGHFNTGLNLKELVNNINIKLQKNADHLRKSQQNLQDIVSNLQAIEKKKTGSLMNKSLREYVTDKVWVHGEYLTTVLVVVPLQKEQDFKATYQFMEDSETNDKIEKSHREKFIQQWKQNKKDEEKRAKLLAAQQEDEKKDKDKKPKKEDNNNKEEEEKKDSNDNNNNNKEEEGPKEEDIPLFNPLKKHNIRTVVPDSLEELTRDKEWILYRVVILQKGHEWFKHICREKAFNVRDFKIDDDDDKDDDKKMEELKQKQVTSQNRLKQLCVTTFNESFINWIHLKIIKTFIESVLRFGLPVDFSISVVEPPKGKEKLLLKYLETKYQHLFDKILQNDPKNNKNASKDGNSSVEVDFSGQMGEFYPFVYVPLKFEL